MMYGRLLRKKVEVHLFNCVCHYYFITLTGTLNCMILGNCVVLYGKLDFHQASFVRSSR